MAYTAYQIISFILFLILICLSVILIVLSSVAAKNGGGIFSTFKSAAASASNVASNAASNASATAKDFATIKALEGILLINQIKLTPKEYLTDMKSLYNENTFKEYLKDTIQKANNRTSANTSLINEYTRRKDDPTYVKYKDSYPDLIRKYNENNEELVKMIADCNRLLGTTLVSKLHSAVNPIIEPEISAMTTTISLRGTDLAPTSKQAVIDFANSLPSVGPSAFPI